MNRRTFTTKALQAATVLGTATIFPTPVFPKSASSSRTVRLGGPVFEATTDPESWAAAVQRLGYRAAYCPVKTGTAPDVIRAYESAARSADIIIAEMGAWSNPISPNETMAQEAFRKCVDSLALAEAIGANCCVNISGSKNTEQWAGPHKDNLTDATFDQIVSVTRRIIDEVKPTRTYFTLELMPWSFPDSVDTFLRLLKAIDRKAFAVHLDPANIINSPRTYFNNGEMIRDCFKRLGPHIRSCHAKDITLKDDQYSTQLFECLPGTGQMDYRVFLTELSKLNNIPLMLEHLPDAEAYAKAAAYIRSVGKELGIAL